jgi:hypothetical protein
MSEPIIEGTSALQRLDSVQPAQSPTPMMLIERAMSQGSDIDLDRMERLMLMQERWDKENARKAFLDAMAQFRANAPELRKDSKVDFTSAKGRTNYNYADLEEVSIPIGRVMGPLGLSFWFEPKQANGRIYVTTILQHALGHSEQIMLEGAPDDSGNKNNIQAVGSTITYLERYGLLAITGMAVKGQDTDGRPPKAQPANSPVVIEDEVSKIAQAKDSKEVSQLFNAAYAAAQKADDQVAKDALMGAQKKRLAELKGGQK